MIARVYHYPNPDRLHDLTISELEALLIDVEGVSHDDQDA